MQITRQTDYAIRCILFLASKGNGGVFMVDQIARSMSIPKSFLAKILQRLSKTEIVSSVRGVKGGFVLKKNISDITLLEVINAIDGPISINRCAVDNRYCERTCICTIHPVWLELRDMISNYLSNVTFERLINTGGSFGAK